MNILKCNCAICIELLKCIDEHKNPRKEQDLPFEEFIRGALWNYLI